MVMPEFAHIHGKNALPLLPFGLVPMESSLAKS
jgi:hypothetical protein